MRLDWIHDELEMLEAAGLRRRLVTCEGPSAAVRTRDGRALVNFAANDYLGLAGDPRLIEAARRALEDSGAGAGASPLISGHTSWHARLEARIAQFEGCEAAMVFPSGYAANMGTIAALAGRGDAIFSDAKNHASLVDGCRLSKAETFIYPHADIATLAKLLADARGFRRRLIVTDGLFSMDGDLAPLGELAALAKQHDAMLLVDEAHATGVLGEQGRGAAEALGVEHEIDVRIGTLSKAIGSAGGFVCGQQHLIEWLVNRARPYVFSTAHSPAECGAAIAALDIIGSEPWRRKELLSAAIEMQKALAEQGWNPLGMHTPATPILPLLVGDPHRTMQMAESLAEQGFFVPGIRPPTVPAGESLLRISLSWLHSVEQRAGLLEALRPLAMQLG